MNTKVSIKVATLEVIRLLKNIPRQGSDTDEPEGIRYITISDTLAKKMAEALNNELDAHLTLNQTKVLVVLFVTIGFIGGLLTRWIFSWLQ